MQALLVGSRHCCQQFPTPAIVSTKRLPPSQCLMLPFLDLSPHPPLLPFSLLLTPQTKTPFLERVREKERG
eukprot:5855798-Ditylum_brightwellii.AAC.1